MSERDGYETKQYSRDSSSDGHLMAIAKIGERWSLSTRAACSQAWVNAYL